MKFSVLICTFNRPEMIAHCLNAMIEGTDEKPDEIVVVNSGDERTDHIVGQYIGQHGIQLTPVKTTNKNLAASRNAGLLHCTGDIIAMTDDDAEVFPDWVAQMKRAHAENPNAGAIGGPVIGAGRDSFLSRVTDQVTFPRFPTARAARTVPGVNISYKRAVVEQVGAQDETLFRGEDVDYNWRAQKLGWTVLYDPRVRVRHHHRATVRGFFQQHYMYGRAYYRVRSKWREMYCVYPHRLARPQDFLRALNFIAAAFYEPVIYAARMERVTDKVAAYPLLVANQIAWRGGMVREKFAG